MDDPEPAASTRSACSANLITLIRSDVDDPDAFEFYPGAQWIVEDPGQVTQLADRPERRQHHDPGASS